LPTTSDREERVPNVSHNQRRDDAGRSAGPGDGHRQQVLVDPVHVDDPQRQDAVLAERDPGSVACALAAFRKRHGFERSGLAAWLRLSPDRLVVLALERRPDSTDSKYGAAVALPADRYGADLRRLTEALAG
jgi:hypothetical protein